MSQDWEALFPKYILVRGVRWALRLEDSSWKHANKYYGLTDYSAKTLHVSKDQQVDDILDTLMHELTHLIWSEYGLPKRPVEERVATAFGAGWAAVFVQNPDLLRTITGLRDAVDGKDGSWDVRPGQQGQQGPEAGK